MSSLFGGSWDSVSTWEFRKMEGPIRGILGPIILGTIIWGPIILGPIILGPIILGPHRAPRI